MSQSNVSVVVYSKPNCPYCVRAKALFERKGVSVIEHDLSRDPALHTAIVAKTGWKTVPQIFINDVFVGGSDDVHALDKEGKLDPLLGL